MTCRCHGLNRLALMSSLVIVAFLPASVLRSEEGNSTLVVEDRAFVSTYDESEQMYVAIRPPGLTSDQPISILVVLHGHGSDRWQFIRQVRDECRAARDVAAAHGMLLIAPDYRATTSWMGPAAEADVLQIIETMKNRYRVESVILCGGSMGATGALTFAVRHPDTVDGVVALNGTANLVEYEGFQDAIAASFGGSRQSVPDEYHRRSAEFFPERFTMPLSTTTGGNDDVVPSDSVLRLIEAVRKHNSSVLSIHRPDGGHSSSYEDSRRALEFVLAAADEERNSDQPVSLQRWLNQPQSWLRDTAGPVVSLGKSGQFDDTHLFAPSVAYHDSHFLLWYCGSRGTVAERVFDLGLATSSDGRSFAKHGDGPVFRFGDGRHSILTPCVLKEGDNLRMWFSSTWFEGGDGRHTLHESSSKDGINWTAPSPAQLDNVYAPTIVRTDQAYRMWFVDVSEEPWNIRHANSSDGKQWKVTDEPCLVIDQDWETSRLFYPFVLCVDGVYVMWYGSYWTARAQTTALGFAVSADGLTWHKHPNNPVFRPVPDRSWESHYVTSHSIMRLGDGSYRMWYASRKSPPFVNKYFAISTAVWSPHAQPKIEPKATD